MNLCIFMGNLTRDPEVKYVPSGAAVCEFSLAVNRRWKDADGKLHEEVMFADCVAWNKTAEIIAEYLTKGRSVLVETECRDDVWTDKETGQNRRKKKFHVNKLHFVGGNGGGNAGSAESTENPKGKTKKETVPADAEESEEIPF